MGGFRLLAKPALRRALIIGVALALVFVLAGCAAATDSPQNTFAPQGEVAEKQRNIFITALIPAIIIFILVEAAVIYIVVRYRRRRDQEGLPKQTHGNTKLEVAWTVAPLLLMLGLAGPVIAGIVDLGRLPGAEENPLRVRVIGQQWRWIFEYPDLVDADGKPIRVNDTMYVPVNRKVLLELESVDVIHSFWVPKLAGKQDAIPGRTNRMWFVANELGTFSGQCAEFCGIGHAIMRLEVVVQTPDEFDAWVQEQLAETTAQAESGGGSE